MSDNERALRRVRVSPIPVSCPVRHEKSALATRFKQGKRVEKDVAMTLLAIARMGHLTTPDGGKSFALRGN